MHMISCRNAAQSNSIIYRPDNEHDGILSPRGANVRSTLKGEQRMSTSLRILALSALLGVNVVIFTHGAACAAEIIEAPPPIAKAVPHAIHRYYGWSAPSQLIEGVRRASPLTVPFYGYGWYPGPAYCYGPRPGMYCRRGGDTVISVQY
jgi:hypothetical protein